MAFNDTVRNDPGLFTDSDGGHASMQLQISLAGPVCVCVLACISQRNSSNTVAFTHLEVWWDVTRLLRRRSVAVPAISSPLHPLSPPFSFHLSPTFSPFPSSFLIFQWEGNGGFLQKKKKPLWTDVLIQAFADIRVLYRIWFLTWVNSVTFLTSRIRVGI